MRRNQKGQSILEFAVILPVFVFIGLGIVDITWLLERTANVNYIVSETARCLAINEAEPQSPCTGKNSAASYSATLAAGLRMDVNLLKINAASCDGVICTTEMTYPFQALGAYFPSVKINRTGIASIVPAAKGNGNGNGG